MINKILLSIFLIFSFAYSNSDEFNQEVEKNLSEDFKRFGVIYIKESKVIRFNKLELLYSAGNNEMTDNFKNSLDFIYPKFLQIMLHYRDNIENIYVKGHSSSEHRKTEKIEDKYQLNLILSQERAEKVKQYLSKVMEKSIILEDDKKWLKEKISAHGMSSSKLIYNDDLTENKEKSRRIEIEVVFKEEIIETPIVVEEKTNTVYYDDQCTVYLVDYIKRLLIENPTMQERYQFLLSIKKDIDIANSSFKPIVELNFKHTEFQESTPDNYTDTQSKDITVRYNIFNGFKDVEEKKINKYNYDSNKYFREQIESDLIFALTETFITIQKQNEIRNIARENLLDYDRWLAKEDIKFQNGMIGLNSYAKIQSRDTEQRMNYAELNRKYKDSISTFQRYLDFSVEDIPCFERLRPHSKYLRNKDIAFHDAQRLSPYIKEAEANINLYREKMKKQNVNFYPTVDLIGKKSLLDENYETTASIANKETSLALQARLELYSGGKESNAHEKAQIEYKQKLKKKEEVKRDVQYKMNLSFNKYDLVIAKEELLNTLVAKREDSFLGATYDYNFAKIDANALLDTVDSLYDAKRQFIENKYDLQIEQYKIFNQIGIIKNYILEDWTKD